jgi:hypothetical protein
VKIWMTTQWFRGKRRWEVLRDPTVERELKDLLERLLKGAAEVLSWTAPLSTVTIHGAVRTLRERNVAAMEPAITDPLKSATLWGGVGEGDAHQIAMPLLPRPVNGYGFWKQYQRGLGKLL